MSFGISFSACFQTLSIAPAVFPFPPPLRGRVRVGGAPREVGVGGTPFPNHSPQGGMEPILHARVWRFP
jgi:hypothetical protein